MSILKQKCNLQNISFFKPKQQVDRKTTTVVFQSQVSTGHLSSSVLNRKVQSCFKTEDDRRAVETCFQKSEQDDF